ncbi:sulfite reductase subunit alpha [Rhodothermus profundi]|uniref:assimilatory sulfite reductase (NADPH) n=1 Tax=Rhodothermus profundi TaxID=633813 RepID=A0A1M6R9M6_9BACT|nr:sulfite reductase subunit alpha [Rhodothermus profundi]SHK29126.1 sulfite reductase [NADPH] flavoprotein, alpha-component [Rhodothermus profundi]
MQVPYLPETAPFTPEQRAWLNDFFLQLALRSLERVSDSLTAEAQPSLPGGDDQASTEPSAPPRYDRKHPFPAHLLQSKRLTGEGSTKDIRHVIFSLEGSGLSYEVGDALGVYPENDPELVAALLTTLGYTGEEPVQLSSGSELPIREALLRHYELGTLPRPLLEAAAPSHELLPRLLDDSAALQDYLAGRDLLDLLHEAPAFRPDPTTLIKLLRPLAPRLYSISSSPRVHPEAVHLTVGVVRYNAHGRLRKGVCSTFLAERAALDQPVPVFIHSNPNFRLPDDPDTPIIMIGAGTGIAPFRAFLEEREVTGARGPNWLFFGERNRATDFLYRDELERWCKRGVLTRLDTAFSRDQAQKCYVQHRMLAQARTFYAWLEEGACVYVCGDATRMARDVEAALLTIIQQEGGHSEEAARAYLADLKKSRRYQRDVY